MTSTDRSGGVVSSGTPTMTDRRTGIMAGIAIKAPCVAATTAAITLSGEQTIDGVACVAGDRVLVKDQASGAANGIYVVSSGNWTRASDFDSIDEIAKGTLVFVVAGGTAYGGTLWEQSAADPTTIDVSAIAFTNTGIPPVPSLIATQATARAGTSNTELMTPLRTRQSIMGALRNERRAITGADSVVAADNGKTLGLGGTAFYALTVGAASGFDDEFAILVVNEDTGRGKTLAVNGYSNFILWPGQYAKIVNLGDVWQIDYPPHWDVPNGTFDVYCDFTNGLDTNDGLAAGAGGAFKTIEACIGIIHNNWHFNSTASGQTKLVVNLASNTTDTTGIHFAPHGDFDGSQGGEAITIKGGTASIISVTGADAVNILFGSVLQLEDVTIRSNVNGLTVQWGGKVYLGDGVVFGGGGVTPAGAHISVASGGQVEQAGAITFAGDAAYGIVNGGGYFRTVANGISFSTDCAFTAFLLASEPSLTSFSGTSINLNAHTITGARFQIAKNASVITGAADGSLTYLPGSTAGTISTFATYDGRNATQTNDNPATGAVGEFVESEILVASAVALTTNTAKSVTSISLTAGDWDVWGEVAYNPNAATTMSLLASVIGTAADTWNGTLVQKGRANQLVTTFSTGGPQTMPVGPTRVSIASTTTIYLTAYATFAVNTLAAYGYIAARRAR